MKVRKKLAFWFSGHFETIDGYVFAVCDHAPLVTQGDNEDEARKHMGVAARLYVEHLDGRGEIEEAFKAGLLDIRFPHASVATDVQDGHFEIVFHWFRLL